MSDRSTRVFLRYLAFQVPGLAVTGVVLAALVRFVDLSPLLAAAGFGVWLAVDLVMYPFVKKAYETRSSEAGPLGPLGRLGVAQQAMDPDGYVRVGSELWRARRRRPGAGIAAGDTVRVVAVDGLTLEVEPWAGAEHDSTPDAP